MAEHQSPRQVTELFDPRFEHIDFDDCRDDLEYDNSSSSHPSPPVAWNDTEAVTTTYTLQNENGTETIPFVVLQSPEASVILDDDFLREQAKCLSLLTDMAIVRLEADASVASRDDCESLCTLSTKGCTVAEECEIDWAFHDDSDEQAETKPPTLKPWTSLSLPAALTLTRSPAEALEMGDDDYFTRGFVDLGDLPRVD